MDAAYKLPSKIALLLSIALLVLAPHVAQAQTFAGSLGGSTVYMTSLGTSVTVTGTSDNATPPVGVSFTISVNYGSGPHWLWAGNDPNPGSSAGCVGGTSPTYTTPFTLNMIKGCVGGQLTGDYTATVTLTPTSASPTASPISFTVNYTAGSTGFGTITADQTSLTVPLYTGSTTTKLINLSTSSSSAIQFSVTSQPASWLTVTTSSNIVQSGTTTPLTLTVSAVGITTNQTTNIVVTYLNSSITIPVTLQIGGATGGTLGLSTTSVGWTYYTSSGTLPAAQTVSLTSTSATTYGYSINSVSTSPSWLMVNYSTGSGSGIPVGTSMTLSANPILASLVTTGSYTATVLVTDSNGLTNTITVTLNVNGSTGTGITISPSPISYSAALGSVAVYYQTVTVSSGTGGTLSATLTTTTGVSISSSASYIYAGNSAQITLLFNPSGLPAGTYTGTLSVTVGSLTQYDSVTFTIGSGTTTTTSATVAPTALQYTFQSGSSATIAYQNIVIVGSGTFTVSSPTYTAGSTSVAWLSTDTATGTMSSSGRQVIIFARPGTLPAGTYSGYVTVSMLDSNTNVQTTQNVTVTMTIISGVAFSPNPATINVSYSGSGTNPSSSLQVLASDGSNIAISATSSVSWMTASVQGGSTPCNVVLQFTPTSLTNGLYTGSVQISGGGASTLSVPVVMVVTGGSSASGLILGSTALNFAAVVNGSPTSQYLTVTANSTTSFTAYATVTTPVSGTWLSISPSGNLTTNQNILVTVNQASLPIGTYNGNIALYANGVTTNVPVTLVVSTTGSSGGNVTLSQSTVPFTGQAGGSAPAAQTVSVSSASGSTGISFTATAASTGSWLSVTPTTATTPATLSISVNPTGLSGGQTYTGTITVSPSGGTAQTITVTYTLTSVPTISVSPTTLSFSYQAGGASPAAQSLSVTGAGTSPAFSATASSSGWLSVSPTSGTAPSTLSVQASPGTLTAGTYNGTIVVSGTGTTQGSYTVNVTLTVTAPLPTITAVVNAASFQSGAVSPGELVTIGGTAIGPATSATLALGNDGKVLTTLGGVQVTFNGYAAPLIYVSATQINAVVPYEVAGLLSPFVQIKYLGQTSNAWPLQTTSSSPAILTQNSSGSGPGAILNQDNTLNTSANPAAKGSTIQIYMTGEGQTTPAGVTGKVTGLPIPVPLLPVAALVNGLPAAVPFYGEAYGIVSGVMQVNVVIPPSAPSGNLSLVISVGGNSSQLGVTVAVQ